MSSTKRVRIDQEKPSCDTPSPSQAAKNALQSYILSLPSSLTTIATKLSSMFLATYSKYIRRDRTVTRLQRDNSKLPHSARFNFSISGSKTICEDPHSLTLLHDTRQPSQPTLRLAINAASTLPSWNLLPPNQKPVHF